MAKNFIAAATLLATTTTALELGFVSLSSDADFFAFVALSDIPAGEVIFFTDNGVTATGSFRGMPNPTEGVVEFTAPGAGVPLGAVVRLTKDGDASVGSAVKSGNFDFSGSGDAVVAYTGSLEAPVFVAALNYDGSAFAPDATSSNTCALPPGLVLGESAVSVPEEDNMVYTGPTTGALADIRAALFDPANFATDATTPLEFTGAFTIITAPTAPTTQAPTTLAPTPSPNTPTPTQAPATTTPTPSPTTKCVGYELGPSQPQPSTTHSIRGANKLANAGATAPVTIEGVVTADHRLFGANGFYLQTPLTLDNPAEKESAAIFVYCGSAGTLCAGETFSEGDYVSLSGTTSLFSTNPQITNSNILTLKTSTTKPSESCPALSYAVHIQDISLPFDSDDVFAPLKGSLVHIPQVLTVTNSFSLKFGEIWLSSQGRVIQPTMQVAPGSPEYFSQVELNNRRVIVLDDVAGGTCPVPNLYFDPDFGLRTGWELEIDATAIVSFLNVESVERKWRLLPTQFGSEVLPVSFNTSANPRPEGVVSSPGLVLGGENMLNYFTTLGCAECRGADTAEEFAVQAGKLYKTIALLRPAVHGLQEIENLQEGDGVLETLVAGVNELLPEEEKYDFVGTGKTGNDAIRCAIIYQPGKVTPVGQFAVLEYVDPTDKSRPSIAQTFVQNDCPESRFTFVVNHLKSKGSSCGDTDVLEGESNCGFTRLKHARQLSAWLETDPTNSGSDKFVLVGDFNTYAKERAIAHLTDEAGFVDMASRDIAQPYSLSFDGVFGTLDYMLMSPSMAAICGNTQEFHSNSDEPIITDYNDVQYSFPTACETKPPNYIGDNLFRSSDHDPIVSFCQFQGCSAITPAPGGEGSGSDESEGDGVSQEVVDYILYAVAAIAVMVIMVSVAIGCGVFAKKPAKKPAGDVELEAKEVSGKV